MWRGWQKAERRKRHLNIKKQQYTVRFTHLLLEKIRKLNDPEREQNSEPEVLEQ
jgi:hypothetical protein